MPRKPAPHLVRLDTIDTTPPLSLVEGFIVENTLNLISGPPGAGKSTLTATIAAAVTTGAPLIDPDPFRQGEVVIISPEDHASLIVARLTAAGGDTTQVHLLTQAGPRTPRPLDLGVNGDLSRLSETFKLDQVRLMLVDNITITLGTATRTEAQTRRALHQLNHLAEKHATTVIAISHNTKATNRRAVHAPGGSIALTGTPRTVSIVDQDPDHPDRRIWASAKASYGPAPSSIVFEIVGTDTAPAINWLGRTDCSADELLLRSNRTTRAPQTQAAVALLNEMLDEGPRLQVDIKAEAHHRGIGWRTVQSVKAQLGVTDRQVPEPGLQGRGRSWWSLSSEGEGND